MSKVKTFVTAEPVKFDMDNPAPVGPDKFKVKIPKGVSIKVREQ
tara:strand:+ start:580 stop:711 length:132 start_codon:yes stop_codon:yes gene_type:complete